MVLSQCDPKFENTSPQHPAVILHVTGTGWGYRIASYRLLVYYPADLLVPQTYTDCDMSLVVPPLFPAKSGAKVELRYLAHTDEQRVAITDLYASKQDLCLTYPTSKVSAQHDAQAFLLSLGLDSGSRENLESRWSVQWSTSWSLQNGQDSRKRVLYQCSCGYAEDARRTRELEKREEPYSKSIAGARRVAYRFTGCLAHIEITERTSNGEVTRIMGYSHHNDACRTAVLERLPAVPLHDHVYQVALQQLECGASLSAIQERNRDFIASSIYHDMHTYDPSTANVRYHFLPTDHPTLYRKFSRKLGIDVRKEPQYNIDDWLDPKSPHFKPLISEAVFYYTARSHAGERFQVCVATPDMDHAAWEYGHRSQLVLDGTFGVCSTRLLLFIAMVIDKNRKGVPVAMFLFSAPTGNRATQAGYNTAVLRELLTKWKGHLGKNGGGEPFTVHVAITDTDTKERAALLDVAGPIIERKFFALVRKVNSGKIMFGISCGEQIELISSVDYDSAMAIIEQSRSVMTGLLAISDNTAAAAAGNAGIKHLNYLTSNWMSLTMWRSWSDYGRLAASAVLKIPVDGVVPTTNHLESFNAILKRKHLHAWLRSGHRLRFDFLIFLLVTQILPNIYNHRKAQQACTDWLAFRFSRFSGGVNLAQVNQCLRSNESSPKVCWWIADETRDKDATRIVSLQRIKPVRDAEPGSYSASCISSRSNTLSSSSVSYIVKMHEMGVGSCTCPDFSTRGGACKHLRALRMILDTWAHYNHIPPLTYPSSAIAAREILKKFNVLNPGVMLPLGTSESPPSPPVQPILQPTIDWTLIQGLAEDTTTIDVLEDVAEDVSDSTTSESDISSSDSEQVDMSEPRARNLLTSSNEEQYLAIAGQIQRRVDHDIDKLLPGLHGLSNLMQDVILQDSNQVRELALVLQSITQGLDKVTPNTSANLHSQLLPSRPVRVQSSSHLSHSPVRKRVRTNLLPPSPERRQARKDSHAPL
ncbi:hypothetical protein D9615_008377 [Tricholomella constricta]|uniref:SWIM-type domain-containing protein n=1 Tax=Tricholomella constricta TaxID=117010 RepID=A0A8H5HDZ5_9AGAR|nr:hypothetical protein D9615_008377 [Tricholomella constricta]